VAVDDLNSATAESYFVAAIRAGFEQRTGNWRFTEFVRVDNVFDEEYIGAVLVNAANDRFYAPAAERSALAGVSLSYAF
jgi:iron complex outermembrane receptor protein